MRPFSFKAGGGWVKWKTTGAILFSHMMSIMISCGHRALRLVTQSISDHIILLLAALWNYGCSLGRLKVTQGSYFIRLILEVAISTSENLSGKK